MQNKLALALLFSLAACATTGPAPEPRVVTVQVPVPVAAPCVPSNLPAAPTYFDTDEALLAAPNAATRYQLIYSGRLQRQARLGQLEPVVAACPREH